MEEINDTSVLEEIEQKLDSMNLADKIHVIGDLACGIHAFSRLDSSEEMEAIGERIVNEGQHMKMIDALTLLKKIANTL